MSNEDQILAELQKLVNIQGQILAAQQQALENQQKAIAGQQIALKNQLAIGRIYRIACAVVAVVFAVVFYYFLRFWR